MSQFDCRKVMVVADQSGRFPTIEPSTHITIIGTAIKAQPPPVSPFHPFFNLIATRHPPVRLARKGDKHIG